MINKEIIKKFTNQKNVTDYLSARLSGDTKKAPPSLSKYHGVEGYEDILFAIYHSPAINDKKKQWFLNGLKKVAGDSWKNNKGEVFKRIVNLCTRLQKPENAQEWSKFLPDDSEGFHWEKAERHEISAYALIILKRWDLRKDKQFWENNFYNLLPFLEKYTAVEMPLLRIYEGIETIDRKFWVQLLISSMRSKIEKFPAYLLQEIFLSQWVVCKNDKNAEEQLLIQMGEAIEVTKEQYREKIKGEYFEKTNSLLEVWFDLPWGRNSLKHIKEIRWQMSILKQEDRGKKEIISPRAFQTLACA